jgi:hypothetical protein
VDTHWFSKKKGWVSGLDKAARGLFAAALIVTTFGPLAIQNVQADPLEWSGVNAFDDGTNDVFWRNTGSIDLVDVNVCEDGTVFSIDDDGNVYRSSDNGLSWELTEAGMSAAFLGAVPVRIVCSPNYGSDGAVLILFNNFVGSGTAVVAMSTDSGESFTEFTAGSIPAEVATSLAVSGDFDAGDEGAIAIGLISAAGGTNLVAVNTWDGSDWDDAAPWTTGVAITGYVVLAGDHAADVALSPNYEEDSGLVGLFSLSNVGVTTEDETHTLLTSGTAAFPTPEVDGTTEVNNSAGADTLIEAPDAMGGRGEIFLPTNFDADASNPRYYVAIDAATGDGDVYERTSTGWENKNANEATATDYVSLDGRGEFATPILVAAQASTTDPAVNAASGDADAWNEESDIWGGGVRRVAANPNGTYWFVVSIDGATSNGSLVRSANDGGRWNGMSLLNDTVDDEMFFFTGGTSNRIGMLMGPVGDGSPASDTVNALFTTGAPGSSNTPWIRGDRKTTSFADEERIIQFRFAPDSATTVWAIDNFDDIDQVNRSTDSGLNFAPTSLDPGTDLPISLLAVSATEALVADDEGFVWRTTNSGGSWTKSTTDLGSDVHMMVASPNYATDMTVIAGVTTSGGRLEVMRSADNGATWTLVGSSSQTGANEAWGGGGDFMHVAIDPRFATNGIIYAGPNGGGDDIYRYDLDATSPEWVEMDAKSVLDDVTRGLQVVGVGSNVMLYAVDADAIVARTNCPDIIDEEIDDTVCEWLESLFVLDDDGAYVGAGSIDINEALFSMEAGGAVTNYVAVDNYPGIFAFTETAAFLAGPTLSTPRDASTVPANSGQDGQPFNLRWQDVADCTEYEVQVSNDPSFVGALSFFSATETVLIAEGTLANGETNYWRVRCIEVNGDPFEGPWSNQFRFTVGTPGGEASRPDVVLPLNNSQLAGLSTAVTWNNPPGTQQVQIRVTPLNGDGPQINLIIGSAITQYVIPAPEFGTGPYVMLPGASYTVIVRSTNSLDPNITESDPSWSGWSDPVTFTTAPPTSGTIQLLSPINGATTDDTTPTLQWKDSNTAMFYYEVQLSMDPNFGAQGAVAPVYWNLVHAGESNPPSSWTVPDAFALTPGVYYWRARQRVQATPRGILETGIEWTSSTSFVVAP